jgi:hypothetical protein
MHPNSAVQSGSRGSLSLVTLEALPCGCVSSVYRVRPSIVELELVEAKGPHCLYYAHQTGRVVRMGIPGEFDED